MRRWFGIVVALCGACGQGQADVDGGTCPAGPATCPSTVPSYSAEIAGIISSRCTTCHEAGAVSSNWPLSNYGEVYVLRLEVQAEVASCAMPEVDAGQLTTDERDALIGWLECGAPNN